MKRNQIVMEKDHGGSFWSPYGRINRVYPDGTVQVIYCTKHVLIQNPDDLIVVTDYKGYWERERYADMTDAELLEYTGSTFRRKARFHRMPTLRRLRQKARHYYKGEF